MDKGCVDGGKHKRRWSSQNMLTGHVTYGCEECGFSGEVWVKPDDPSIYSDRPDVVRAAVARARLGL